LIRQAMQLREQWDPKVPPDSGYRFQLPDIYTLYAGMLWATGDVSQAIVYQQRSLDIYARVMTASATGPDVRAEFGLQYVRLANFLQEAARGSDALKALDRADAVLEPMFAADRQNAILRRVLIWAFNQRGAVLAGIDPRGALTAHHTAKQLADELLIARPDNPEVRELLADGQRGIASALAATGDRAGAGAASASAVTICESLAKLDPKNAHYAFSLAQAYAGCGDTLLASGNRDEAAAQFRKSIAVLEPMVAADPVSALKRRALGEVKKRLGLLESL
jgi:tetratricopeptide (TPR) repeat protein